MDQIELFTNQLCPFAMRVRLTLAEKAVQAREFEIDLRNKPAWFLEISPQGKVPLLRHAGKLIWESSVICEYLDEIFPVHRLIPEDSFQRAEARMWIKFADSRLYGRTATLLHSPDRAQHAPIMTELTEAVLDLERKGFASPGWRGPYLSGAEPGLADLALYPWFEQVCVLERYFGFRMPIGCRQLDVWREAVAARDSVRTIGKPPAFYLEAYGQLAAA